VNEEQGLNKLVRVRGVAFFQTIERDRDFWLHSELQK
jgi:hypothetical protein